MEILLIILAICSIVILTVLAGIVMAFKTISEIREGELND
jgi:hypothetical protein